MSQCLKYKAKLEELDELTKVFFGEFMRRLSKRKDEKTFLAPGSAAEGGKKKKNKKKQK